MSFRHLNKKQNDDVAELLLTGAKAIGVAALLAVLFPGAGSPRPIVQALLGVVLAALMATLGVWLHKNSSRQGDAPQRRRKGR